jgi:fumarate reductase subunit C
LNATQILKAQAGGLARRRRWPARLDLIQSASGLTLALFMVAHSLIVGSLLLGPHVFEAILSVTDGSLLFGRKIPELHAAMAALVALLFAVHAALAMRKFPQNYREHRAYRDHVGSMRHSDTTLWYWQVVTGFLLFFLVSVHLYTMITQPDRIGPVEASTRIVQGRFWLLYLPLTPIVQFHSLVGLYRLALKWGWVGAADPLAARRQLRRVLWPAMAFFIALGLTTLAVEINVGLERAALSAPPTATIATGVAP